MLLETCSPPSLFGLCSRVGAGGPCFCRSYSGYVHARHSLYVEESEPWKTAAAEKKSWNKYFALVAANWRRFGLSDT